MANTLAIEIENEINSNKHRKDPFQQKYLDLTTSVANCNDVDFLSRNLRLRATLITAQLTTLSKELDTVATPESSRKRTERLVFKDTTVKG